MEVYTEVPIKGRIKIGEIEGDKFIKEVNSRKHKFKLFDGYAIQKTAYDKLIKMVKTIVIKETDTKSRYEASTQVWEERGATWTGKDGKQKTLSLKYMTKI